MHYLKNLQQLNFFLLDADACRANGRGGASFYVKFATFVCLSFGLDFPPFNGGMGLVATPNSIKHKVG